MNDEIIDMGDIYLQDIVCSVVAEDPLLDENIIYNKVSAMVEISSIETVGKILNLIRINKTAFVN